MVDINTSPIRISLLEKLIVNWAILPDAIYYLVRSHYKTEQYPQRTLAQELQGIWERRIRKYHKLLMIKKIHGGSIPERVAAQCTKSPCDYTRLLLAYIR